MIKGELDRLAHQTDHSLHQLMKKAYIGYLGMSAKDLLSNQDVFDRAETLFSDLNLLLRREIEPLLRKGKQLSNLYFQSMGDRTYLDQFTVRELRLKGLRYSNDENLS